MTQADGFEEKWDTCECMCVCVYVFRFGSNREIINPNTHTEEL